MKNSILKIFLCLCLITAAFPAVAADLKVRITREDFADFYGVLIIEENFKDLYLDEIFFNNFNPVTGILEQDELFSVRSPEFKPNILTRLKKEKPEEPQTRAFKGIYNVRLSSKPFNERLLDVNNMIKRGSDNDKAIFKLHELEKKTNNNPLNISNIAKLYLKMGKTQKALSLLKQARELSPDDFKILYIYGVTLYKKGQLDLAEESLKKITLIKPDFMYAHYNLGNLYYKRKE